MKLWDTDKTTSLSDCQANRFGKLGIRLISTVKTHPQFLSWKERGAFLPFLFACLLCGILLLNCSVRVRHEYDKKTNFSKYKTYTWVSDKPVNRSLKIANLIETAIKKQLSAKGYVHGLTEEAEFGVMYYGGVKGNVDVVDYDFTAWRPDYGQAGSGSPGREEGTLFIEIVDMKKRMMVWRGWAGVFIDESSDMEQLVNEVVGKILVKFPPQ